MASLIPGFEYDICLRKATVDKSSSVTARRIIKKEGVRARSGDKELYDHRE
jgi:hypothetical protein